MQAVRSARVASGKLPARGTGHFFFFKQKTKNERRPATHISICTEPIQKAPTHLLFFPPDLFFFLLYFQALLSKWRSKTPKILFAF
jgi:hypothetical protein